MLPDRCDFRTCHECSCGPNECRVSDPIRLTKANDMRGVFTPDLRIILATIALFAVSTAIVVTIAQLREDARAYEIARNI